MTQHNLSNYHPHADGTTDDTPALQRCFADAQAGRSVITIPPGNYFLSGQETIPLCSGLTVSAHGARFHLPKRLGDRARITLFGGTDIRDLAWHGGHFEGHCFDPRRPTNTWEPNVSTRAIAVTTSPGGRTDNLLFRQVSGHRVCGAVITVEGLPDTASEDSVDTFATGISVRDCNLLDCGKFMWDYGLLWQILVWPEDYTPAETDMARRYFPRDLISQPVRMDDGDDRVRLDNSREPLIAQNSEADDVPICFFGDSLPRNVVRGRRYYVVDTTPRYVRVADTPGGAAIRFEGAAGGEARLICNLSQAYMHLFQPIGCGPGKGAVDLVACRHTSQTGNRLSALGDTMHVKLCHDNVFANNQIIGSRMGALYIAEYCRSSVVTGNTVDGTNGSRVMSVERSSEDVTIVGNTFRNGGRGSWINQPQRLILQGNVFVNNTTKGERNPRRGRRSFQTGEYQQYPELYFTLYEPDGEYGPVIVRDNIFVTGPECQDAIDFGPHGHDLLVEGNVLQGPVRSVRVAPSCERVHIGANLGMVAPQ